jgi:hypothetical protein
MLVIIDIDGSIADWKPRNKAAGGNPGRGDMKAYKTYITAVMKPELLLTDKPVEGMLTMLRGLSNRDGVELVYLTGRSEAYRAVTERWLMLHRFPEAKMVMRGVKNWAKAVSYKEQAFKALKGHHSTILAFEDEPEVVAMLIKHGVTVMQVHYNG